MHKFVFFLLLIIATNTAMADSQTIRIGLNADMSGPDYRSGEAIRRGTELAISQINADGGVLGRSLELVVRDHRRNPARGIVNVQELASDSNVVAIMGGKHTPVILAELEHIHKVEIPYLVPWAAGTSVVENGYHLNYVFRVSVRDEYAGNFLVQYAAYQGYERIALLLEHTGWGRSNERAITDALQQHQMQLVRTDWFNWGQDVFDDALQRFKETEADVIIFVGNVPDGIAMAQALLQLPEPERFPVISHWGITGGDFQEVLAEELPQLDVAFLQTFSFFNPPYPERAELLARQYVDRYDDTDNWQQIMAPTGVAHAYDLTHLLAQAIERAGSTDRAQVKAALEEIDFHPGVVRDYVQPFTADYRDALSIDDFSMARFCNGTIKPSSITCEEE
ncbi:ABC transporter substrate-binding protein [Desulfurispira natronophila]|uniref:Branched-chain amino acid transport system substrate-binding protein n=1 Tax=Desulfurispira natronophila TaxID=682562 RepID=A0A7W7Y5E4_9BACT|nr:ABC transporter substrate-binding protein [Desulfurispira natronophila]MBB5022400.1 branched-chain amino acid transport system substrate-binding protein [Desulfurispira natronophila]